MKEKKFIGFKVAVITTIVILFLALAQYIFVHFDKHQIQKNIWADVFTCFILLLLIFFQILNLKLFSYLETQVHPPLFFIRLHSFLLIVNSLCVVLLLLGTAQLFVWRNTSIYQNTNIKLGLLICVLLFIANSITIISSLRLRNYLQKKHDYKEQELLANIGKL